MHVRNYYAHDTYDDRAKIIFTSCGHFICLESWAVVNFNAISESQLYFKSS